MSNRQEDAEQRGWVWLLLVGAASLLGTSLWLLVSADESAFRGMSSWPFVLRQGGFGLLALALAWGIGNFSLHRPLLRRWYLFPALLLMVMVAAPISEAMGSGRLVYGYGWWTRSIGVSTYILALIFSVSFVLPRFARSERGGAWAMAVLVALLVAIPLFILKRFMMTGMGLAVVAIACSLTLPREKLARALFGLAVAFLCALFVKHVIAPDAMQRIFNVSMEGSENFQLRQAILAVHSGGLLGWASDPVWIPEWHTDFMFARLCGAGGWGGGLAALVAVGAIFTLAWNIAIRQEELRARVLAAACVGAFILPALLHVAVNLGLFPTLASNFPFLSYAPNLLLLNGLLLGLLLSLAREPCVRAEENSDPAEARRSRWPMVIALVFIWGLIGLFALRIGTLVYGSPHLQELRQCQIEPLDAMKQPSSEDRRKIRGDLVVSMSDGSEFTDSEYESSCFLTTACTSARGLPDDCRELQTLRAFREQYMKAVIPPAVRAFENYGHWYWEFTEITDVVYVKDIRPMMNAIELNNNFNAV